MNLNPGRRVDNTDTYRIVWFVMFDLRDNNDFTLRLNDFSFSPEEKELLL